MRVPTLAFVTLTAVPSDAIGSPLSELAAAIEPGEWAQLETEGLLPVLAEQNGGATASILPYSEDGVWDPTTGQFFFIGSDHIYDGMSSGARFIAFSDATNAWRVVQDPIPWAGAGTMHGYDHAAMLDGGLYQMTLIAEQPTWRWDTATETWEERAPIENTNYNRFGALEPFPEIGGLVYVEGGSVHVYDDAQDAWSTVATDIPMGGYHNFAEYNPVHGIVLFGGGNDSGALHAIDADLQIIDYDDAPFPLRVNEAIVTVDPNSGDYLLLGGDGRFVTFDPTTQMQLEQPGEVPWFTENPVDLTIAGPVASYGVVMFVKHFGIGLDGSAEVWIYRHAPGQGEPPGEPPGDEGGSSTTDAPTDDSSEASSSEDGGAESSSGSADPTEPGSEETSAGSGTPIEGGDASTGCGCTSGSPRGLFAFAILLALRRRRPSAQERAANSHD
jgi:hypothetical protein